MFKSLRLSASESSLPALILELDFRHPNDCFEVPEEAVNECKLQAYLTAKLASSDQFSEL